MNKERIFILEVFNLKRITPPDRPGGVNTLKVSSYFAIRRLEMSLPIALNAARSAFEPVASKYCLAPVFGLVDAHDSSIVFTLELLATLKATE